MLSQRARRQHTLLLALPGVETQGWRTHTPVTPLGCVGVSGHCPRAASLWAAAIQRLCSTQGPGAQEPLRFAPTNYLAKALRFVFLLWSFELQGVWGFFVGVFFQEKERTSSILLHSFGKANFNFLLDSRWCGSKSRNATWDPSWTVQVSVQ